MRMVKVELTNGRSCWLNPDHVIYVGRTVMYINRPDLCEVVVSVGIFPDQRTPNSLSVVGSPSEIAKALMGNEEVETTCQKN